MRSLSLALLLVLMIVSPVLADESLSAIPLPEPRLTESTLIEGTGWSGTGNRNESLACDLAYNRAVQQLKNGVAFAKARRMISPVDLESRLPLTVERNWNATAGRCTVKLQLEIPTSPRGTLPVVHPRQF